jgi:hypothetical protein
MTRLLRILQTLRVADANRTYLHLDDPPVQYLPSKMGLFSLVRQTADPRH